MKGTDLTPIPLPRWGRGEKAWSLAFALLVAGFVAAAALVSVYSPPFEAPDEVTHFGYIRHLVAHRSIPILNAGTTAENEAGQAPVYYLLGALATLPAGDWLAEPTSLPAWSESNPYVSFEPRFRGTMVDGNDNGNRNLYAHGPDERFPWRGDLLAFHLVRLLSVALGALAVVTTVLTAREMFPKRPGLALVAGALLALNPQFVFISAVVSNDNAAAATAGLTLLLLARAMRRGLTSGRAVALGVALGLAVLAKLSLLGLAPVVGLGLLAGVRPLGARARPRLVALLPKCGLLALATALTGGWWYAFNWLTYGDPMAWAAMLVAQGTMIRPTAIPIVDAAAALFAARDTYWATFGWTNVLAAPGLYVAADCLVALALVGLVVGAGRWLIATRRSPVDAGLLPGRRLDGGDASLGAGTSLAPTRPRTEPGGEWASAPALRYDVGDAGVPFLALLALWVGIVAVSLVRWIQLNTAAAQGRLLFPAAGAIAILLAVGLAALVPSRPAKSRRLGLALGALLVVGLVAFDAGALLALPAAYRPAPPVAGANGPGVQPLDAVCDCGIEFLGYRYVKSPATPDDTVAVEFFWRVNERQGDYQSVNWIFHVGLRDAADRELAKAESWPDAGRLPTRAAAPGAIYCERVEFRLPPSDAGPGAGTIAVTPFFPRPGTVGDGTLATKSGKSLDNLVRLGRFRWPTPPAAISPARPLDVGFAGGPTLVGVDAPADATPGSPLAVRLYWRADEPIPADYTVSLQALDASGKLVGQADSQPSGGRYPMTLWQPGEVVVDARALPVNAPAGGPVRLLVVVYRGETGERLRPVGLPNAADPAERAVEVGRVAIGK